MCLEVNSLQHFSTLHLDYILIKPTYAEDVGLWNNTYLIYGIEMGILISSQKSLVYFM
jgi:hypothetical protein